MRIRIFLSALLLAFSASAQTPLPARQVSVNTNGWASVAPTSGTAQASFDWIDLNWMAVDASAFLNMPTNLATCQLAFDWIDLNWMAVDASSWTSLPTNASTAQAALDWIDANLVVSLATNGWVMIAPTATTSQAAFDSVDAILASHRNSISNLAVDVAAHGDAIVDINSNLQDMVRSSELCGLVDACLGTAPAAGEDLVFYGNAAYSAQEFVVDTNMESLSFFAWGAGGNAPASAIYGAYAGAGAFMSGTMAVDASAGAALAANSIPTGAIVRAYVGIPNFGQNSEEGGGGRATRVHVVYAGATNLLFVAGGGGGAAPYVKGTAGAGGAPNGYAGATTTHTSPDWGTLTAGGGAGGTTAAGGAAGVGAVNSWTQPLCVKEFAYTGVAGALWSSTAANRGNPGGPWYWSSLQVSGTTCASGYETSIHYGGGQGGDGYYGGGGGGSAVATSTGDKNGAVAGGGGGGGSSWASSQFAGATNESTGTKAAYTNSAKYVSGYGGARQPGVLVIQIDRGGPQ